MSVSAIRRPLLVVCALALLGAGGAAVPLDVAVAQGRAGVRGASRADSIPTEYLPPAGMCRIWLENVPPMQQPAPTDCGAATRNKPANGRVVYGPRPGAKGKGSLADVPIKRFGDSRGVVTGGPPAAKVVDSARVVSREPWENKRVDDAALYGDPARAAGLPGGAGAGTPPQNGFQGYVGRDGVLIGTGGIADPRYFNPNAPPPGRGSSTCLDRDGDGWCDDFRFGPPPCLDRDRDGRCDDLPAYAALPYPQVLPRMQAALDVVNGLPSVEVAQWLGTNEFIVRLPDGGRGGVPWRAIFLDANGQGLMQVWSDRNRDGVADRIEIFRDGQRVKLIQR